MGIEDYIDFSKEHVITVFEHSKKRLKTVIGMTNKRSFMWQSYKRYEKFVSSKLPITTINFEQKAISPIVWVIAGLFLIMGISFSIFSIYMAAPLILLAIFIIIIASIFGGRAQITTYIGGTMVYLTERGKFHGLPAFIKEIHQHLDMAKSGFTPSDSMFNINPKRRRAILIVVVFLIIIGIMVGFFMMSYTYYSFNSYSTSTYY
ncbi:MAG: hypothetical protein ACTSQP_14465 [Promethearchaeota archaeon]